MAKGNTDDGEDGMGEWEDAKGDGKDGTEVGEKGYRMKNTEDHGMNAVGSETDVREIGGENCGKSSDESCEGSGDESGVKSAKESSRGNSGDNSGENDKVDEDEETDEEINSPKRFTERQSKTSPVDDGKKELTAHDLKSVQRRVVASIYAQIRRANRGDYGFLANPDESDENGEQSGKSTESGKTMPLNNSIAVVVDSRKASYSRKESNLRKDLNSITEPDEENDNEDVVSEIKLPTSAKFADRYTKAISTRDNELSTPRGESIDSNSLSNLEIVTTETGEIGKDSSAKENGENTASEISD